MRRIVILLLAFAFLMAGCSSATPQATPSNSPESNTEAPTQNPTEAQTEIATEVTTNVPETPTEPATDASEPEDVSIVLLDSENIYVEFRGIDEYSSSSWIVNLYVENNRDSEIYLSLRDNRVNDYVIGIANNGISIPAGGRYLASPNYDLIIRLEELAEYRITTFEKMDFNLKISTSLLGDEIVKVPVSISVGKTIKCTDDEAVDPQEGDILFDASDLCVRFCGITEYSSSTWVINLYVENNRDSEVYLSLRNVQINKFSVSLSNNGISIPAGSKYLASPNFDLLLGRDDLDAYGIKSIDDLNFTLKVSTSLLGDQIVEKPIALKIGKTIE